MLDTGWRHRLLLGGLLGAAWIGLGVSGLARAATLGLTVASLRASGLASARTAPPDLFVVGGQPYQITFGCTPVGISLCLLALLLCSRLPAGRWLGAALLATGLAGPLMVSNTVVSVHLHQRGLHWTWAHYPGSAAVYALLLAGTWALARALGPRGDRSGPVQRSRIMTLTRSRPAAMLVLALALASSAPAAAQSTTPPPSYDTLRIGDWHAIVVPSGVFFRRPTGSGPVSKIEIVWGATSSRLGFVVYTGTDAVAGLKALGHLVPLTKAETDYILSHLLATTDRARDLRAATGSWTALTAADAETLATQDLGFALDPEVARWGLGKFSDDSKGFSIEISDCAYKAQVRFLAQVFGLPATPSASAAAALRAGAAAAVAGCTVASARPTGVPPAPAPATPPPAPAGPTVWAFDPCPTVGDSSPCVSQTWTFCTCTCNASNVWVPNCSGGGAPVPPATAGGACTTLGEYNQCGTTVCSCAANPTPPPPNVWTTIPPPPAGSLELLALAALAAAALGLLALRRS